MSRPYHIIHIGEIEGDILLGEEAKGILELVLRQKKKGKALYLLKKYASCDLEEKNKSPFEDLQEIFSHKIYTTSHFYEYLSLISSRTTPESIQKIHDFVVGKIQNLFIISKNTKQYFRLTNKTNISTQHEKMKHFFQEVWQHGKDVIDDDFFIIERKK